MPTFTFTLISGGQSGFDKANGIGEMYPKGEPSKLPMVDGIEVLACGYTSLNMVALQGLQSADVFSSIKVTKGIFEELIFDGESCNAFVTQTRRQTYWEFNTTIPLEEGERYTVHIITLET